MKIIYETLKTERVCTDLKEACKFFGGNRMMAISLLSRINAITSADTIKDIINQRVFRFHNLHHKNKRNLEGYFAVDVKTIREPWRLIIQPLNEMEEPYDPCNIDEITSSVRIVGIKEVSKHYE